MGWFDEQLSRRRQNDCDTLSQSMSNLSAVIMGRGAAAAQDERTRRLSAVGEILNYFHIKPAELPESITGLDEQLEYLLRPSGVMRRTVKLSEGWYREGIGPLLGKTTAGISVALLPHGFMGYRYFDPAAGKFVPVTKHSAGGLDSEAICFYKPFPARAIGVRDLLLYAAQTLSMSDIVMIVVTVLAGTLMGLFSPYVNNLLFDKVVPSGVPGLILPVAGLMLGVTISTMLLNITRSLIMGRIQTKLDISVQAASMARMLSLPAAFFKEYASGDLSSRLSGINSLCSSLVSTVLTSGLTSLFSLIYIGQISHYAPELVIPSILVVFATILLNAATALLQMGRSSRMMVESTKTSGLVYALFLAVTKLKLAGAERRAFSRWANQYAKTARLKYALPLYLRCLPLLSSVVSLAGTIAIYYFTISSGLLVGEYMAFNISYGMMSGAFLSLSSIVLTVAGIKPTLDLIKPILKAVPELASGKRVLTRISGGLEVNNVTFRYAQNMPPVLDNISLKIRSGQYIAIVGATGCGKSTLLRLLLGFETPQKGAVYYDGKDIQSIDLRSLRRHIGVVLQNGKLFQGDVFSNITISAPWLTLEDAWEAAEIAGLADDIRAMPMGMHTIISEGGGGISGGQRQRLMIARAVAPKPKLLMFDEATSALDNITQDKVSTALDQLKCTRLVIAHRLSTIRQCDRIVVLEKGKILEDGGYDELLAQGGYFSQLVARQRLDDTAFVGKTTVY